MKVGFLPRRGLWALSFVSGGRRRRRTSVDGWPRHQGSCN